GTFQRGEVTPVELVRRMIGREIAVGRRADRSFGPALGETVLEARGLARTGVLEPSDLTLRAGEIVGLAGLLGSGRSELAALLFGAMKRSRGSVSSCGRELRSVRDAIDAGVAYAPEERQRDGLVPDLSVRENLNLVVARRFGPLEP